MALEPEIERTSESTKARVRFGMGLFLVAIALYFPALDHEWLNYDDDIYITANPNLARGLTFDGVAWAFSQQ